MTPHATADFETSSEAGFNWDEATGKWRGMPNQGSKTKGLNTVGAAVYAEHPSTRILCLSYRLPGQPKQLWRPGLPLPWDLFAHLAAGGLLECHKLMFEWLIWETVATRDHGFPSLRPYVSQLRCSMAKARVASLPGALGDLSEVLRLPVPKDKDGTRLLNKFSIPRNPTKSDPRKWIRPEDDPADFARLEAYCLTDIDAEEGASARTPEMSPAELEFWQEDQEINRRGLGIDRAGVRNCIAVMEQAFARYEDELWHITGGLGAGQLQEIQKWLRERGVNIYSMDKDEIAHWLAMEWTPDDPRKRVLEIRQLLASASVKKLYGMEQQANGNDRLIDLIIHHGTRTGRPTGGDVQPLNLPKDGPPLRWCGMDDEGEWTAQGCRRPFRASADACLWCGHTGSKRKKWDHTATDFVLEVISWRSLDALEWYIGDALLSISGCVRGLFTAAPGYELIDSDYSVIEAVVLAELCGCEWRREVFRSRKDIYLMSAAKITGRTLEFYEAYKREHKEHHPDRNKIGKIAELGLGFGGWIGGWRGFDKTDNFTDDQVKDNILAWRAASPEIPEYWGGQTRRDAYGQKYPERYGVEGMAINAIQNPGMVFEHRGIKFYMRGDALIIQLLSTRELTYWNPRLSKSTRPFVPDWELAITYMTSNKNPKYGPTGWVPMSTFGGRLTENIVQATAHDILRHAILLLKAYGYPTVLHVYDEIVLEVLIGTGSVEMVEWIMEQMPWWAKGWPVRASGGWRGVRFRKAA